ncbi:hypothetical protein DLM85_24365 [Hymenobacter edaphi]|uniref:Uncharacterized protein n=1 Tax=Hymenobacter edaphi TaxID=2211146 RepID=A0A328B647_9BACT|nr:hypothetical protein DLM85_24365 [Hymenobacter edaphi]
MSTSVRPASPAVTTVQPVFAPTPERPAAAAPVPAPARPRPATASEADDQARCDFYAWCAGYEGYGSIF